MEYSKDIVLGVKFFNGEDKLENITKKENRNDNEDNKNNKARKNKVLKFMNEHKFITSISITCFALMMIDCVLVYSFVELLQKM
ncbi:MAG: hypothetical protein DBY41_09980 [Clostridium sp.]|mgnify:FL=1|jgi:hypothetical protein|nr:MAG: hypothetical protein DBY41_09980 [Clostridium sp.]